jgi:hypothetical protein
MYEKLERAKTSDILARNSKRKAVVSQLEAAIKTADTGETGSTRKTSSKGKKFFDPRKQSFADYVNDIKHEVTLFGATLPLSDAKSVDSTAETLKTLYGPDKAAFILREIVDKGTLGNTLNNSNSAIENAAKLYDEYYGNKATPGGVNSAQRIAKSRIPALQAQLRAIDKTPEQTRNELVKALISRINVPRKPMAQPVSNRVINTQPTSATNQSTVQVPDNYGPVAFDKWPNNVGTVNSNYDSVIGSLAGTKIGTKPVTQLEKILADKLAKRNKVRDTSDIQNMLQRAEKTLNKPYQDKLAENRFYKTFLNADKARQDVMYRNANPDVKEKLIRLLLNAR